MRNRIIIVLLLVFVALGVAFWFSDRPSHLKQAYEAEQPIKSDAITQESGIVEPDATDEEISELSERFTPEEIENLRYSHQAAQAANQNVTFYGQCVDQDGKPIPGVQVEAKLTKMRKSMTSVVINESFKYHENLTTSSDENGRFSFVEKGSYLVLEDIEKEGYLAARGASRSYSFGRILTGATMAGIHQGDPLNPVVFTLWEKGEGSAASEIPDRNGANADFGMQEGAKDKVTYLDLGRRIETTGPSENSIKITLHNSGNRRRDPLSREIVGTRFPEWSYTLEIPGGGIVLTDDLFLFRPPELGYEESFSFEVPEGEEGWINQVEEQRFYFKTAEGNYGAFALNVRATATGAMGFRFKKLLFNPTGERNLENF